MHNNSIALSSQQLLKLSKLSHSINEAWLEDLNPLLDGSMKIIYNKISPVQIRMINEEGKQISVKQMLKFRFMIRESGQAQYDQLNIQIQNDKNLFFVYMCKIDQKKFQKIKKQQGINFSYGSLLSMLIKQLQLCDKQINQYTSIFYLNQNSNLRLDFIQNIEYKRIELISLQFQQLSEQLLKDYISYRFTKLKKNNQLLITKINTVISQVKLKNLKLLKAILDKKNSDKIN